MNTLIVADNHAMHALALELGAQDPGVRIVQSIKGALSGVDSVDLTGDWATVLHGVDWVLSLHCRQLFPKQMVEAVRCVNVHPGLNPHNRGLFPHVFSIINGRPAGVTIHEIDARIDHGPVIVQQEVAVEPWDTSTTLYARVLSVERRLVLQHYASLRDGTYQTRQLTDDGNLNSRADFDALCQLDPSEHVTIGQALDRLRALTHEGCDNAYFKDGAGRRIYVRLQLTPEDSNVPETAHE